MHLFYTERPMLSYQHGYHAGNFADVIKHLALTRLLAYMTAKDKPLLYLETHAGKGMYDLWDKQAQKTAEAKKGINLLWENKKACSPLFEQYLHAIRDLNPKGALRYYPGSPALAIKALRPMDRLYFCELHPNEFEALEQLPRFYKKVHVSNTDGILSLNALVPPPEKRALIFIDPSFEIKSEYKSIPEAIKQAYKKFSTGVYCLWYPLVDRSYADQLVRAMKSIGAENSLYLEFIWDKEATSGMYGCGMWLINPPYVFAQEMQLILKHLCTEFNPGSSSFVIKN